MHIERGTLLALGLDNGCLVVYHCASVGAEWLKLQHIQAHDAHATTVHSVAFRPGQHEAILLASGGEDGALKIWQL